MKIYEEGLIEEMEPDDEKEFEEFWDRIFNNKALADYIDYIENAPSEKHLTEKYRLVPRLVEIARQILHPGEKLFIEYALNAAKIMIFKDSVSDLYTGAYLQKFQEAVSLCDTLIFDPRCDYEPDEEDGLVMIFLIDNVFR